MDDYSATIVVDRPPGEVFAAVTNVRGWWSENIGGPTARADDEFTYSYGEVHRCRIRVTEARPENRVAWRILENHFDFTENQDEWVDTEVTFDITSDSGQTRLLFTHRSLTPQSECYGVCSNAWTFYVTESLRDLIVSGHGQPNPKEQATDDTRR